MDLSDLVGTVIRELARDRVVHFLVAGAVLFALAPRTSNDHRISLHLPELAARRAAQALRLGVPALSDEQRAEVDRRTIEDAVLYREAVRLGLDRGDSIVRRHLVQKVLLLAEDLAGATREPTREELAAYFARTRDRWRIDEQVHLIHVFAVQREALLRIEPLVEAAPSATAPPLGDAFPRSRDLWASRDDLEATYGREFADAVSRLPTGQWSEPIGSRYGWHLVRVVDRRDGHPATFDEVADRVRLELTVDQRHRAIASFLRQAFDRYEVDIDGKTVTDYSPTNRLAVRSAPSAED